MGNQKLRNLLPGFNRLLKQVLKRLSVVPVSLTPEIKLVQVCKPGWSSETRTASVEPALWTLIQLRLTSEPAAVLNRDQLDLLTFAFDDLVVFTVWLTNVSPELSSCPQIKMVADELWNEQRPPATGEHTCQAQQLIAGLQNI